MALTSASTLADAMAQYRGNLAYWESATKAASLLEAVLYLLAFRPEVIAAADQNVRFADLESLRVKLGPIVEATASTRSRASFVKGRCQYY